MKKYSGALLGSLVLLMLFAEPLLTANIVELNAGYFKEVVQRSETLDYNGQKFRLFRDVIDIPAEFGPLLTITSGGSGAVLWFQNEQGQLRNVSVDAARNLLIQRKGSVEIQGDQ